MSFFPSADPDEDQTPYAEGQSFFAAHPSAPLPFSTGSNSIDYNPAYGPTTHGLPNSFNTSWASSQFNVPQGLGLQYPPNSYTTDQAPSITFSQPASTSFTWPADFTPTQTPTASSHGFRTASAWSNGCEAPSTVQPAQLWDAFQPANSSLSTREASPGQSEYSTSSYQSTASSPFVRHASSPGYGTVAGSPLLKTESDAATMASSQVRSLSGVPEYSNVDAHDFAVLTPATTIAQRLSPVFSSASLSDAGDSKPSMRPSYRRAYSAADTEEVQYQGRRKRSLTRPENANCSCEICGKLFQRCYNLKAHMETHEPNRNMPNKCKHPGCGKRFVRRTDLLRHNESVHVKSRPYECTRCHNTFARKDTLQRHLDDGCPMRPEVRKRPIKPSRSSPPIKEEPQPQTPFSQPTLSPAAIERLRRS